MSKDSKFSQEEVIGTKMRAYLLPNAIPKLSFSTRRISLYRLVKSLMSVAPSASTCNIHCWDDDNQITVKNIGYIIDCYCDGIN